MSEIKRSCIDCAVSNCHYMNKHYPDFCPSTGLEPEFVEEIIKLYEEEENRLCATTAALVETDYYCQMTRLEEIIEFAKRMGAKKLGIATCIGLLKESGTLARILRNHGFEVFGVGCKCGTVRKVAIGIPEYCENTGVNICNPILQAKLLNKEQTDLNIVMGLCVGHDSLFYKYAEGLTTTLVVKDRVLGHNPAAALYQADFYYKKKLEP